MTHSKLTPKDSFFLLDNVLLGGRRSIAQRILLTFLGIQVCYLLIRLFTLSNDSHQEESLLSLCVPPKKKKDFGPFISLLKHLRRFSQQPHATIYHSADETRVSREDSASIGLIVLLRVMFIAKIQTFPKPRRNRHFVQECQSTPQEDNSEFQYLKNIA